MASVVQAVQYNIRAQCIACTLKLLLKTSSVKICERVIISPGLH